MRGMAIVWMAASSARWRIVSLRERGMGGFG
jgi:hypothetical protein